jgi:class 3 adenylate cyclase
MKIMVAQKNIVQSGNHAYDALINTLQKIIPESQITFSHKAEYCCAALVDIVNSTNITSRLSNVYACMYYDVFLNMMSAIATDSGATVVKNIGDSLLFFFPSTIGKEKKTEFRSVIESLFRMIDARPFINQIMSDNKLPEISYRISCDFGAVMMADSKMSNTKDIFGTPVNFCSKMNRLAQPNQIIIGGDMYQCIKKEKQFVFEELKSNYKNKIAYSVYIVKRNQ